MRQPQSVFLRRALCQVHLWTGIGLGLYVVVICLSGSVLVYRTELQSAFSPKPVIVAGAGVPMSIEELTSAARRAYPGYEISAVRIGQTANHAAEIAVEREGRTTPEVAQPDGSHHPRPFAAVGDRRVDVVEPRAASPRSMI